ncbi:hypothetical protein [Serratia marcescens]|uniref:hypothetical protein n=1 Tax=Serratia marcescens TaxID=615 RepID=UPI003204EE2A
MSWFFNAQKRESPELLAAAGAFLFTKLIRWVPWVNYKRILLRLTMKNGLEVDAPVTRDISKAAAWAIRVFALTVLLYGVARLIVAVRWW